MNKKKVNMDVQDTQDISEKICPPILSCKSCISMFVLFLTWFCSNLQAAETPGQNFVLREYLGKTWSNEVVVFQLDTPAGAGSEAHQRLLGPEGKAVPFQYVTGTNGTPSLAFQTDLPEFSEKTYRLENSGEPPPSTDLRLDQEPACIRITNSLTGLEIPTAQGAYTNGPFLRMKLRSGTWIGASRLLCKTAIESYTATVVAAGPVYAEVECRYRFADGKQWQVNFRVEANEPVVRITETCNLTDGSAWQVLVNPGFSPNHALSSVGFGTKDAADYRLEKINYNGSALLSMTPWPIWWNPRSVSYLGLFKLAEGSALIKGGKGAMVSLPRADDVLAGARLETKPTADEGFDVMAAIAQDEKKVSKTILPIEDFLAVAVGQAESWANPGDDGPSKTLPLCTGANGELFLSCSLSGPGRRWLLAAQTTKANLVPPETLCAAQQAMVKHLETPLNEVVHMILAWDSKTEFDYPRLVTSRSELAARPQVQESAKARRAMKKLDRSGVTASKLLYPALKIFLGAPDQPSQSVDTVHRCERIIRIATAADMLLGADVLTRDELTSALGFDAIEWGHPVLTDKDVFSQEDIRYARAQLAFLCYKLFSPNYYSPERNFRANPNMTTTRYCAITILASLIPDHPLAKQWAQGGLNEVERELKEWTGPNGGWLESPHYQTVAMSSILLLSMGARQAGFTDYLNDVRLARAMRYLARISTPPDIRFDNKRHFPPVGNTYQFETTGLFGVFAKACRNTNRELSDELQWAWIQQGRSRNSGIGGDFYNNALYSDFVPASAPKWGSESFPGSGAVLRNGFPSARETYLYMLQGGFAEHYDYDRGSFEFWGKGQPLCLDWGYDSREPAWLHNRVDVGNWGDITVFQTAESADYLHSFQEGWDRQLLFVKDADPLGPNYYVMRDTVTQPAANWWMWFYTEQSLQLSNDVLHVTGIHDVDLDLWLAPTATPRLKIAKPKIKEKKVETKMTLSDSLGDVGQTPEAAAVDPINDIMKEPAKVKTDPPGTWIETKTQTVKCFDLRTQTWEPLTQEGLTLPVTKAEPVFCVLYPRLKTEKPPAFVTLANGRGVKVTHATGTDYVFMSATPFEFHEGDITFKGRAGVIRVRGTTVDLTLGEGGEIAKGDKKLSK